MQLKRYGVKFQSIQHIFISHLHGDHFFGLPGLLSSMHLLGREKELHIYGPKGLEGIIRSMIEVGRARLAYDIKFHELDQEFEGVVLEDKVLTVECFKLNHKIPTHGFIVREKVKDRPLLGEKYKKDGHSIRYIDQLKKGQDVMTDEGMLLKSEAYTTNPKPVRSYAYCSDTAFSEHVVNKVKNVDVLYHEATFLLKESDRAKKTKHSTASDAARVAKAANVKRLYIGHLSARYPNFELHLQESKRVFEYSYPAIEGQAAEF